MSLRVKFFISNGIGLFLTIFFVAGIFANYDNSEGSSIYMTGYGNELENNLSSKYVFLRTIECCINENQTSVFEGVNNGSGFVFSVVECENAVNYTLVVIDEKFRAETREGILDKGRYVSFELREGTEMRLCLSPQKEHVSDVTESVIINAYAIKGRR